MLKSVLKKVSPFPLILLIFGCTQTPKPGSQLFISDGILSNSAMDGYYLYLPRGYSSDKKWPVILFLQGSTGMNHRIEAVKEYGPAKHAIEEKSTLYNTVGDQFIIINPHLKAGPPEKRQWFQFSKSMEGILDFVNENYNGDPTRTYITGLSKGASGCWGIAKRLPHRFAAMIAIAGRINCESRCEALENTPTWVVHNTGDERVTYDYSRETVDYLQDQFDFNFHELEKVSLAAEEIQFDYLFSSLPDSGHDAWTQTYSSASIYEWMLSKKKK